jgi:hypothetical protein
MKKKLTLLAFGLLATVAATFTAPRKAEAAICDVSCCGPDKCSCCSSRCQCPIPFV